MFEPSIVGFTPASGGLDLRGCPILLDADEAQAVHIAVSHLADDLEKVTGRRPAVWTTADADGEPPVEGVILVGSLPSSRFLRQLDGGGGGSYDHIQGKWETFQTQLRDCPFACAQRMLVIAGSDKRGAVFGVYTLSEQMGVSPWYWWADVPIQHRDHVYALPRQTRHGPPSVQYRGLFINDEAPALTEWARAKFGGLNSEFYKKFFELLLRMKANFFWPAMWAGFPRGSSFFADDPANQPTAHAYGVVVSTSHHEPMQRAANEWRTAGQGPWAWERNKEAITDFFDAGARRAAPFESVFTLGMRGASDDVIDADDPQATLRDVIATQRRIVRDVYGREDAVPQVMALYKEVQEYYDDGLAIPDDVTLLFADDNFGNIRRLPTTEERQRRGGSGIYYHLEYVGHPRSYKWLNTNSCAKMQQQLQRAHAAGVSRLWIFNVGDVKPVEMPATLALALAWDVACVTPSRLETFFAAYAAREFAAASGSDAAEIARLLLEADRLRSLRRHESIEPGTFSVLHYREADRVLARYRDAERRADALLRTAMPLSHRAAFFQLVLHPLAAPRICTELRVAQARNRLHGAQRRNTTNVLARRVLALFDEDWELAAAYHANPWSGDKWNHILRQPHYGFAPSTWHAPSRDLVDGLCFVQRRQDANPMVGPLGVAVEGHPGVRPGLVNEESDRMQPSRGDLVPGLTLPPLSPYAVGGPRYFEVYTRGTQVVEWTARAAAVGWLVLSPESGRLSPDGDEDQRVEVTVRWEDVPEGFDEEVVVDVRSTDGWLEQVHLRVRNHGLPPDFSGYVEADGCVAVEAGSLRMSERQRAAYQVFPYLGRTASGAVALSSSGETETEAPWLCVPVFLVSHPPTVSVRLYFTTSLDTDPGRRATYQIGLDEGPVRTQPLLESAGPGELPVGWAEAVQDGVWIRDHAFSGVGAGAHRLRYRPLSGGLLLEKIVVDLGGVRESYLGPPASRFVGSSGADLIQ